MFDQSPDAEREQISRQKREFSARVKSLSSDVHRLSHELHPAKLEQLGLVAALRGFCREFPAHAAAVLLVVQGAKDVYLQREKHSSS
jgi:signal transduction histidine kinase